jgi:hypothetical protein
MPVACRVKTFVNRLLVAVFADTGEISPVFFAVAVWRLEAFTIIFIFVVILVVTRRRI